MYTIYINPASMVDNRRLGQVGVFLADHACTGDANIGQVDAGAERRLSGVFTHIAFVHAAVGRATAIDIDVVNLPAADHDSR